MAVGDAITKGVPVPIEVPPQLPVNHRSVVPDPPVADRLMFPESSAQKLLRSTDAEVGAVGGEQPDTLIV